MIEFEVDSEESSISLEPNGEIEFYAYSYTIDSLGNGKLTQEQTKEFFKAMYKYYSENDPMFLEECGKEGK